MIGRLHKRRIKRNELGRRENEVRVREVPFVASHENSSIALRRENGFKEDSVFFIWEAGGIGLRFHKQAVSAEVGDYRGGYVLVQMKFRTEQYIFEISSGNRSAPDLQ